MLIASPEPSPLVQTAVYMAGMLGGYVLLTRPEEWAARLGDDPQYLERRRPRLSSQRGASLPAGVMIPGMQAPPAASLSAFARSPQAYGTSSRSTASTSRSRPASASACSVPTAPARPPPSRSARGSTPPDAGEVVVLGRRWGRDDRELRERLGISLQETQFSEKLTVAETVAPVPQLLPRRARRRRGDRPGAARGEGAMPAWASSPAASSSGWRWPARWWATPSCSSSTSRPPGSTPSPAASSGS